MSWPGAGDKAGDSERVSGLRARTGLTGHPHILTDIGMGVHPAPQFGTNHRQCFIPVGTAGPSTHSEARMQPGVRAHSPPSPSSALAPQLPLTTG